MEWEIAGWWAFGLFVLAVVMCAWDEWEQVEIWFDE